LKLPEHLETNIEIFDYVTNGVHCSQQKKICVVELKKTIQEHLMNGLMVLFSCSDKDRPAPWLLFPAFRSQ
jgi:hypothetical protein